MPSITVRVARTPKPCGNYPCRNTIRPGDEYRRHVGFPGDGGVNAERPWVINECPDCAARSEIGAFAYIVDRYQVPAARDVRVTVDGVSGVIVGASGDRLLVRLDGAARAVPCHPTWRITYHV